MPSLDTDAAVSTRRDAVLVVRDAAPADYPAIRDVVIAAYRQYADLIPPDIFSVYVADLLELDRSAAEPIMAVAFVRHLTGTRAHVNGARPDSQLTPEDSMTTPTPTPTPTRRVSTPAYYLGRPAGLWLAALTSRSATRTSCAST